MLKKYLYINGKITLAAKPVILINDIGFLRGYGVFDFMRTFNGKIFHWAEHWQRFVNSAKLLDLKIPLTQKDTEKIIYNLIKKNFTPQSLGEVGEAGIRLILTGGSTLSGLDFDSEKPTLAILIEDIHVLPTKLFKTGAKLITFDYQRLLPSSKNLNYIQAVKLQKEKKKKGAVEILYTNNGKILECSTSNFFLVKGHKLITPKTNVLSGITRQMVLDLARKNLPKTKIEERDIKLSELKTADEVFVTATNKNILPIVKIDNLKISNGQVGELTKQISSLYSDYVKNY